MYVKIY